jgi:drug/metabolite transporter (DMT)-like permease
MKPWVGWMFGLVGFEVLANFFAKSWGDRGGAWRFWVASLLYFTCNASWLYALRAGVGLARGATLFAVLATLFTYSMGVFVFGERPTRVQLVGSVLALVAVVLLLFGEEST